MKIFNTILKIAAAIAAVAGIAYLVVKYLDDITEWLKGLCPCKCVPAEEMDEEDAAMEEDFAEDAPVEEEAPAEEAPAEEEDAPAEEDFAEDAPAEEETPIPEGEPVAEESDFEE